MILTAAWPTTLTASPGARTIAGVAVPWNTVGTVSSGQQVRFLPGSLDAAARPPALRDHDPTRPFGRVIDATDDGTAMRALVRASAVPAGDEALILAADGVTAMFSVGVEPTDYRYVGDVLEVVAGDWRELTLLTLGAFDSARVATVTAMQGANMTDTATATDAPTPPTPDVPDPDDDNTPPAPAPTVEAAGTVPILHAADRPPAPTTLTIRDVAQLYSLSRTGPAVQAARARQLLAGALPRLSIEAAALTNVTMVGANSVGPGGAAFPELVDIVSHGTPLIDALSKGTLERGDYPNKVFNRWTTGPTVAVQAAEKTDINSTAVDWSPDSAPVITWAGGNDISIQTLTFGAPSFIEDYIRAAAADFAKKTDTYAAATLLSVAGVVAPGASFVENVGKLVGALNPANVPAGDLFLAVSWDVGVGLIGVTQANGAAFWDGNVSFGKFIPTASVGGLSVFVDPNFPAKTYLLGMRQAAKWDTTPGSPYTIDVYDVLKLGRDLAVYGFGALEIRYPAAFQKMTLP